MAEQRLTAQQRALVESAVDRVDSLARRLSPKMPQLTADDLRSAGHEGLVEAALRYDPESGVPFSAFSHYRIRGAMIDASRRAVPQVRQRTRAMRALETTQALLEQAAKQNLTGHETRTLTERVAAARELVAETAAAVVLTRVAPEDPDSVLDDESDAESNLITDELRQGLRQALVRCEPPERALIEALYFKGLSMHEYAQSTGVHVSTVSRQHARIIKRLHRLIPKALGP